MKERDVKLAIQLRNEGCQWKLIAYGLGKAESTVVQAVREYKKSGPKKNKKTWKKYI